MGTYVGSGISIILFGNRHILFVLVECRYIVHNNIIMYKNNINGFFPLLYSLLSVVFCILCEQEQLTAICLKR